MLDNVNRTYVMFYLMAYTFVIHSLIFYTYVIL